MESQFTPPWVGGESTIAKDLNLNLQKILASSELGEADALLATLALAESLHFVTLAQAAAARLLELGVGVVEIQEARESSAIMGMLNTYYKFRSFLAKDETKTADYSSAGLRMTALARPILGKTRFEMLAFTVSVLNGCETCVLAHENVLRQAGLEPAKIHDLARLAAVVKALKTLSTV